MIRLLQLAALAFTLTSFGNAAPRPNILLIVSEDNGPELGCYGEPSVQTPNLDRLASKGVLFERAYVPQAGCSQSRAAFLTGLYIPSPDFTFLAATYIALVTLGIGCWFVWQASIISGKLKKAQGSHRRVDRLSKNSKRIGIVTVIGCIFGAIAEVVINPMLKESEVRPRSEGGCARRWSRHRRCY